MRIWVLLLSTAFTGVTASACPDVRCDLCVPPGTHTCRIIDCFGNIKSTFTENCALPVAPLPVPPGQLPPPPTGNGQAEPGQIYACPFECNVTCGDNHSTTALTAYGATEKRAHESINQQCLGERYVNNVPCYYRPIVDRCYVTDP